MTIRDTFGLSQLETELAIDEGRVRVVYRDTRGFRTVGIGHNLDVAPLGDVSYPLTDAQVDALFANDIASTIDKLDTYLPWWRVLDPVRQRVLINMAFNLGIGRPGSKGGLLSFARFLYLVQAGQYQAASDDMLNTLWHKQVGDRAVRLSIMMRSGLGAHNAPNPRLPPAPHPIPVGPVPTPKPVHNSLWENLLEAVIRFLSRKV